MNIEAFLLCDAATDQRGKLNILGAFDHIIFKEVPGHHPALTIAARIRFEKDEAGEHPVKIFLVDADGNPVGPQPEGNVNVRIAENASTAVANLILNIHRLEFKQFGEYLVDLAIDGIIQASLPLQVKQVPLAH